MNPIFTALISLFLLGTIPTFVRFTCANPVEIGIARLFVATFVFYFFVRLRGKKILFTQKNWWQCALLGLCFGTHWLLYFQSIKIAGVVIAALGLATYGVFMLLIGHLVFKEKAGLRDLLVLSLTLAGCLLILPKLEWKSESSFGLMLGLTNAFFFSITMTLQKKFAATINIETRTFSQYLFAFPVFLILWPQTHWQFQAHDWLILFILGLACTAVAHSLWIITIEKMAAKTSGILYYLSTFFAVLIGGLSLREFPALKQIVGGGLIVLGSLIATAILPFWPLAKKKEA